MRPITCRFYRNELPKEGDLVRVRVLNYAEVGFNVELLEYDNLEGLIQVTEISQRRIKFLPTALRVGNVTTAVVVRVDKAKRLIDVSKKRVTAQDNTDCRKIYAKAKLVTSIAQSVAARCGLVTRGSLLDFMERCVWALDEKFKKGGAFEAFKQSIGNPAIFNEFKLTPEEKDVLLQLIKLRMEPKKKRVKADIELSVCTCEGVASIRSALSAGLHAGESSLKDIKIGLIAPPKYALSVIANDKSEAFALMNNVISCIERKITQLRGVIRISTQPYLVDESGLVDNGSANDEDDDVAEYEDDEDQEINENDQEQESEDDFDELADANDNYDGEDDEGDS